MAQRDGLIIKSNRAKWSEAEKQIFREKQSEGFSLQEIATCLPSRTLKSVRGFAERERVIAGKERLQNRAKARKLKPWLKRLNSKQIVSVSNNQWPGNASSRQLQDETKKRLCYVITHAFFEINEPIFCVRLQKNRSC